MKLELSDQEAQIAINLFNEAAKSKGLENDVAEHAVYLTKKIKAAYEEEKKPKEEVQPNNQ